MNVALLASLVTAREQHDQYTAAFGAAHTTDGISVDFPFRHAVREAAKLVGIAVCEARCTDTRTNDLSLSEWVQSKRTALVFARVSGLYTLDYMESSARIATMPVPAKQ